MNTNPKNSNDERILDLMIQQATGGLSEAEQQELDRLVSKSDQHASETQMDELEKIELTAAALDVSLVDLTEMPDSIRDQVLLAAEQHFESNNNLSKTPTGSGIQTAIESGSTNPGGGDGNVRPLAAESARGITRRETLAMLAVVASLALLLSGWNPLSRAGTQNPIGATIAMPAAEQMQQLVESKPADLVRESWVQVDKNYPDASGEVIWSDEAQEGYMVLTGIEPNDPSVEQFQLWIFDTDPAQAHPVDGGVFDIVAKDTDPSGKIVIPINAHIPVKRAVQFAVTVERPGGVTVSNRERIPVLAKLASLN